MDPPISQNCPTLLNDIDSLDFCPSSIIGHGSLLLLSLPVLTLIMYSIPLQGTVALFSKVYYSIMNSMNVISFNIRLDQVTVV